LENYYGFLGTYTWYSANYQSWVYDGSKDEFFFKADKDDTSYALTVENSHNVKTTPYDASLNSQKWHVEYCWNNF